MKHAIRIPSPDILAPEIEKLGEAVNRLAVEVFQLTTDIEKELTQKSALRGAAPDASHMARSMPSASVVSGGVSSGAPDSALEAFPTEIPFPEPGADASVISADSLEVGEHQRQTTGTRSVLAIGLTCGVALLVAGFLWTGQGSVPIRDVAEAAQTPAVGHTSAALDLHASRREDANLSVEAGHLGTDSSVGLADPPVAVDAPASGLRVSRFATGSGVVDREVVGSSDAFAVGTSVVFWTHMTGGRPGDTIGHVWLHEGREASSIVLPIGSPNWRTHSRHTLAPGTEGDWVVELRTSEGRLLASKRFRSGA